jgi:hypothetical protein
MKHAIGLEYLTLLETAAAGVPVRDPERVVVALAGDGGMRAVLRRRRLPDLRPDHGHWNITDIYQGVFDLPHSL